MDFDASTPSSPPSPHNPLNGDTASTTTHRNRPSLKRPLSVRGHNNHGKSLASHQRIPLHLSSNLVCGVCSVDAESSSLGNNNISPLVTTLPQSCEMVSVDASTTNEASSKIINDNDNDNDDDTLLVRSTLSVQGICCTSEVPAVRHIVRQALDQAMDHHPKDATTTTPTFALRKNQLQINIAQKQIYVRHNPQQISATTIAQHLTEGGFSAMVLKDGGGFIIGHHHQDTTTGHQDLVVLSKFCESTIVIPLLQTSQQMTLVQNELLQTTGVRAIQCHLTSRTCKVEHNPQHITAQEIAEHISSLLWNDALTTNENTGISGMEEDSTPTTTTDGADAYVIVDGQVEKLYLPETSTGSSLNQKSDPDLEEPKRLLTMNVVVSGAFWVVSMLSFVDGLSYLKYAGLMSVLFGLPPVAIKAWKTIRRRSFDANCMMVIAALGALALGEFDEAASVSFLFCISEALEVRATQRARKALSAIVHLRPDHANVLNPKTKEITILPADDVPVGSLISVRTGDKIVADGVVVEGTSSVDESSLTGESVPVQKTIGSSVSGGSINIGNTQLIIRTTTSVEDSAVSRLIRLVEEAQANTSPTEMMIDRFARAYTPTVIGMAAIMATIPWIYGAELGRYWTLNALIIIVVACPCALTISTPVTYAAGLAATAQRGIIVKGGASLEALGNVDSIIFDKTGTLTEGNFKVSHLQVVGEHRTKTEMLSLLALMEAPSSHPLAPTLVAAAKQAGATALSGSTVREHRTIKGEGVEGTVGDRQVYVGNKRLFQRIGMYDDLPGDLKTSTMSWGDDGGTVGFIGVEGEGIIGAYCVTDKMRPEAKSVVGSLLFDGYNVVLLTGDGEGAAKAVGRQIGLTEDAIHSQLLPEDKLHFVGSLKQPPPRHSLGLFGRHPKVLFCGDGVNDAPALATADIGVSMGEGAAVAMEMSDVTLMDSNLSKILYVLKMGSRVMCTVRENILLSLFCKLVVVGLTFAGYMTLLYAIASDVGVMLLVTVNGMKLLPRNTESEFSSDRPRSHRRLGWNKYDVVNLGNAPSSSGIAEIV